MTSNYLRHRHIFQSPSSAGIISIRQCISAMAMSHYATAATNMATEEINPRIEKKGKWFTLPPFTSTIDGSSLGKEISGRRADCASTGNGGVSMTAIKWVIRCCPQLPSSLVQKLFRLRQVRRETSSSSDFDLGAQAQERRIKRVAAKDSMNVGDEIHLPISVQDLPSQPSKKQELHCSLEEVNFIHSLELYKDAAIIVVNKPHGMPVQGGVGIKTSLDDLAGTYLRHDYPEPPRLVHRLDRDSSGILVFGRTQTSTSVLHSIFREKTFGASNKDVDEKKRILQKKYWALVIGSPRRPKGIISAPLGKVVVDDGKSERITIIDSAQTTPSQHATTEYRVIKSSHGYSWLELSPLTGRKHQLRVHCAEVLGTPIVGDYKYGWQAHKNTTWPNSNNISIENIPKAKTLPFGLDLENGSISEKQPRLHLHCKQMILPNVSLALEKAKSGVDFDISKLENLKFEAPLPLHMQRSWDVLSS